VSSEMCRKLLANHVIEDVRFQVEKAGFQTTTSTLRSRPRADEVRNRGLPRDVVRPGLAAGSSSRCWEPSWSTSGTRTGTS